MEIEYILFLLGVSIPIGFSQALQQCLLASSAVVLFVSIPIGFSQALQLQINGDV